MRQLGVSLSEISGAQRTRRGGITMKRVARPEHGREGRGVCRATCLCRRGRITMAVMPILDPGTRRAYLAKRRRRFRLPGEPRAMTFSSWASLLHGNPIRRRLVAKTDDWQWPSTRWFAGIRPVPTEMDGKVMCIQVQVRDYQSPNGPRHCLVPAPRRGDFEHVRAPDNRGTPARHNSIGALKMPVFPGDLTQAANSLNWRAGGWRSKKRLNCRRSDPARHFEMWRAGGWAARRHRQSTACGTF